MTLRFLSQHYVTGFTRRGRKTPFCWGSLVADMSRGIAYISYDGCGNPNAIYFTDGSVTKYSYSATGQKLGVEYRVAAPNVSNAFGVEPDALSQAQTLYAGSKKYSLGGSLIFKDGMTDRYLFDGGYTNAAMVSPTNYHFAFYFYNKDHLGNIREVVAEDGTVCQVTNYYPSGVPYTETNSVMNAGLQPYKYNGKELDLMHGLKWYDYGARMYDPILLTWNSIDPMCEKYYNVSPYAYCHNNPIILVDYDGKDDWYNKNGVYLRSDNKESDNIVIQRWEISVDYENSTLKVMGGNYLLDTTLTAKAYSNIFTDILSKMPGIDIDDLHNGSVSTTVYKNDLNWYKFIESYNDAYHTGGVFAEIGTYNGKQNLTAYINIDIPVYKEMLSTVSNIQNLLGVHEYTGHYKCGYIHGDGSPDKVVELQKSHPSWETTTPGFKQHFETFYE